jgi:DNA-binding transcriptional ArsR family regulator
MITIVIKMDNDKIFRALSSLTRIKILQRLNNNEMHLSGLAKEIGISKPVTSRHIKILEEVGLIDKKIFGNTYILKSKIKNLETTLEPFIEKSIIELDSKKSIFDALKQIPGIEIKKVDNNFYIKSIDGDDGYYVYEVDGKLPKKPIDEYKISKNITLDLKKLVSVKKKEIKVNVKNSKKKNIVAQK